MRILFIYPNLGGPVGYNTGIGVMSAILKKNGHEVRLLHLNEALGYGLDLERVKTDVAAYGPDLIGVSVTTSQFPAGIRIAQFLKSSVAGNIPMVFGGIHPTLVPEEVLGFDCVDMVVVGEGEGAMLELAEALQNSGDVSRVRNVWLKKDGAVIRNRLREFADLKALPFMDTRVWDYQKMIDLRNGWIDVLVGRGCPHDCTYCFNGAYKKIYAEHAENKGGRYLRTADYGRLIAGLKEVVASYRGIRCVCFVDDDFLLPRDICELVRAFKKEINLPFVINAHVDSIDAAKLEALKNGGCDLVRTGIESGNGRIRGKVLGRTIPDARIIEKIGLVKQHGLRVYTYNMVGLPFEGKAEVLDTIRLNALCRPEVVRLSTFCPYPKTGLYAVCRENGLIGEGFDGSGQTYYDASPLVQDEEFRLFLDKLKLGLDCYLNSYLEDIGPEYLPLVAALEKAGKEEYESGAFRSWFKARKLELAGKLYRGRKLPHYTLKFTDFHAVLCEPGGLRPGW